MFQNPEHLSESIHPDPVSAIKSGHFSQVRYLLELNPRFPDRIKSFALSLCALIKDDIWRESLAHTLLEYGARVDVYVDQWKLYPLHYAVLYNRLDLTKLLLKSLDRGFNINKKDSYGNSALHLAVLAANLQIIVEILKHCEVYKQTTNCQNRMGITPLMMAYRLNRIDVAQQLIFAGADLFKLKDVLGYTAHDYRKCFEETNSNKLAIKKKLQQRRDTMVHDAIESRNSIASKTSNDKVSRAPSGKLATRLQQLHKPPSNILKSYPIPMDVNEPFFINNAVNKKLSETYLHVAHHADSRNDCLSLFQQAPLDFFGSRKRKLMQVLKSQTLNNKSWKHSLNTLFTLKSEQENPIFMPKNFRDTRNLTRTSNVGLVQVGLA